MNNNYELYHYGVRGMKWGARKRRESSSGGQRPSRTQTAAKIGTGLAVGVAVGHTAGRVLRKDSRLIGSLSPKTLSTKVSSLSGRTSRSSGVKVPAVREAVSRVGSTAKNRIALYANTSAAVAGMAARRGVDTTSSARSYISTNGSSFVRSAAKDVRSRYNNTRRTVNAQPTSVRVRQGGYYLG